MYHFESTPEPIDGQSLSAEEAAKREFANWKHTCRHITNTFRDEQCNILTSVMWYENLLSHYVNNTEFNEEYRDFILNDFLEESCTALMKRRHIHWNTEYNNADHIASCCRMLVAIAVPLIKVDHPLSWTVIYYCLNAGNPFFRTFGLDWREMRGIEISDEDKEQLTEWRDSELKEGDHVDYLRTNRWKYGQIKKITVREDPQSGTAYRELALQPQMSEMWPMQINHQGNIMDYTEAFILNDDTKGQITKPFTKSMEQMPHMMEWRKRLTADQEADEKYRKCQHLYGRRWRTAIVLEEDKANNEIKVRDEDHDDSMPGLWVGRYCHYCVFSALLSDVSKCHDMVYLAVGNSWNLQSVF